MLRLECQELFRACVFVVVCLCVGGCVCLCAGGCVCLSEVFHACVFVVVSVCVVFICRPVPTGKVFFRFLLCRCGATLVRITRGGLPLNAMIVTSVLLR